MESRKRVGEGYEPSGGNFEQKSTRAKMRATQHCSPCNMTHNKTQQRKVMHTQPRTRINPWDCRKPILPFPVAKHRKCAASSEMEIKQQTDDVKPTTPENKIRPNRNTSHAHQWNKQPNTFAPTSDAIFCAHQKIRFKSCDT